MKQYSPWVRRAMDLATFEYVSALGPESLSCYEVSGTAWQSILPWKAYRSSQYPEVDVCRAPLDGQWDVIIIEQVLEHVRSPWKAVSNLRRN